VLTMNSICIRCRLTDINGMVNLLEESTMVKSAICQGRVVIDPLRLCVRFKNCTDATVIDDAICEKFGIYCELNEPSSITYVIPPFSGHTYPDTNKAFNLLSSTLTEVSSSMLEITVDGGLLSAPIPYISEVQTSSSFLSIKNTNVLAKEVVGVGDDDDDDDDLVGRVAAETVCSYPPGIPVLVGSTCTYAHISAHAKYYQFIPLTVYLDLL